MLRDIASSGSLLVASLLIAGVTSSSAAQSCHLWYNDSGASADMLVNSVMIDATAPGTYYETHGWNFGSDSLGAGYAGIQDTGTSHNFIVSIWDFSPSLQLNDAAWIPPGGTYGRRFGGEGTGFQIINPGRVGDVWQLGVWSTIVTRSMRSGTGSIVAAWSLNHGSGLWTLQGVHRTPAVLEFKNSAIAFLENYSGRVVNEHRRMFTRDGGKRTTTGIWQPFTKGWYDGPNPFGNGGKVGSAFFMEMGSSVVSETPAGSSTAFTVSSVAVPNWAAGRVVSVRSAPDPSTGSMIVEWRVDETLAPPVGYEVELSVDPSFPAGSTIRRFATEPWTRSAIFSASTLPSSRVFGRLRIVDILDRTSDWFPFEAVPVSAQQGFDWASAMTWTSVTNGWGPPERDRSIGETGASDGRTLTLNGATYARGIGCHATSRITIALNQRYDWFLSDVGVDDEIGGTSGSIVFRVYVDGGLRYDSGLINGSTSVQSVMVDVMGGSSMLLEVTDGGDGRSQDHADWAGARLIRLGTACEASAGADCDSNGVLDACQIGRISTDADLDGRPDSCQHALGDLDLSHVVDGGDVAIALLEFGLPGPSDLDGSGLTDFGDIALLLLNFGPA